MPIIFLLGAEEASLVACFAPDSVKSMTLEDDEDDDDGAFLRLLGRACCWAGGGGFLLKVRPPALIVAGVLATRLDPTALDLEDDDDEGLLPEEVVEVEELGRRFAAMAAASFFCRSMTSFSF